VLVSSPTAEQTTKATASASVSRTRKLVTWNATFGASRFYLTKTSFGVGLARRSRGNSLISVTATAHTTSSISVRIEWPAPSARSTSQRNPRKRRCWRQRAICRLRQDIQLSEPELAAIEEGLCAYEKLLASLADTPTPAGETPKDIAATRLHRIDSARSSGV
jgi:hypothetical protein